MGSGAQATERDAGSEVHVVLAPELGLGAEALAAAWNEAPQPRELARARAAELPSTQFGPEVAEVLLMVGSSVALGVVSNILYDLITSKLGVPGAPKEVEVLRQELADGVYLIITKREE